MLAPHCSTEDHWSLKRRALRDSAPAGNARNSSEEQHSFGQIAPTETTDRPVWWDFSKLSTFAPVSRTRAVIVQPKLVIGPVDDPLEREADAVADRVMRMPAITTPRCTSARRQLSRKCAACEEEGSDALLQTKRDGAQPVQSDALARESESLESAARSRDARALTIVDAVLRSSGKPLDPANREFFETQFGLDFSAVRLHTGTQAATAAASVNAYAFTVGHDVVFGSGQYAPSSERGRRLLAHELAHVVQQGGATASALAAPTGQGAYGTAIALQRAAGPDNEAKQSSVEAGSALDATQSTQTDALGGEEARTRCGPTGMGCTLLLNCGAASCAVADCGTGTCPTCPPGLGNLIVKHWCRYNCLDGTNAIVLHLAFGGTMVLCAV
jgi:hypothetical protein